MDSRSAVPPTGTESVVCVSGLERWAAPFGLSTRAERVGGTSRPAAGGSGGPVTISVALADDQALVRMGLRVLIESEDDLVAGRGRRRAGGRGWCGAPDRT